MCVLLFVAAGGVSMFVPHSVRAADFEIDVMAVLSKSGCNSGRCHGNQNGRGGLKLSLRGEDPERDYLAITRQSGGRRIDLHHPPNSLFLLKPTAEVAHQGGLRFRRSSEAYATLLDWIQAGAVRTPPTVPRLVDLRMTPAERTVIAPDRDVQLRVMARFSDNSQRDVTDLAVYETSNSIADVSPAGLVRGRLQGDMQGELTVVARFLDEQVAARLAFIPQRAAFRWRRAPELNALDQHIHARLRRLKIQPSGFADDSTLIRRAFLDALGVLPTADEARAFVRSNRLDKYDRLLDRLLARPEFSDHWALKWSDLLRNEEKVLDDRGVAVFYKWIHDSMARGKPLDEFVRELVLAKGSTYENPPTNFYRANRDPFVRAETAARLFLGTRLQCAKCHNHPFERWTQDDYYDWAAVFGRIDYEIVENKRKDRLDKNEFVGEQIVVIKDSAEVKNVRTGESAQPRMLGEERPLSNGEDAIGALARWLTSPHNDRFAQTLVNLIWYHTMGRGLVEPVDDFRMTNPPTSQALMDNLTSAFVAEGFDLRRLVRRIMSSRAYRATATPNATNGSDQSNFSRAIVRRLTAEQLLDAQSHVLGWPADFAGYQHRHRAGQLPGVRRVRFFRDQLPNDGDRFLMIFGKPERLLACECERSNETTLSQTFVLINGTGVNRRLTEPTNRLGHLVRVYKHHHQLVEQLNWMALSRPPSGVERDALVEYLETADDRLAAVQDIAWAIMNSKEFLFRK